jgi:hypothetical protein
VAERAARTLHMRDGRIERSDQGDRSAAEAAR